MNSLYIQIIIWIFLIWVLGFFSLAPFVPTRKSDLWRILKLIDLKENENFLEIWCWTAKVSIFIAQNYPNNQVVWIELSPIFYLISKIKVFFSWTKNLKIIFWNALNLNFWDYDVIYVFWLPQTITKKILPKLEKEMKQSSRFFSYCFQIESENNLVETKHKENPNFNSIYEYKKWTIQK